MGRSNTFAAWIHTVPGFVGRKCFGNSNARCAQNEDQYEISGGEECEFWYEGSAYNDTDKEEWHKQGECNHSNNDDVDVDVDDNVDDDVNNDDNGNDYNDYDVYDCYDYDEYGEDGGDADKEEDGDDVKEGNDNDGKDNMEVGLEDINEEVDDEGEEEEGSEDDGPVMHNTMHSRWDIGRWMYGRPCRIMETMTVF